MINWLKQTVRRGGSSTRNRQRLQVEELEQRLTPTDAGPCLSTSVALGYVGSTPIIRTEAIDFPTDVDMHRITVTAGQQIAFDIDTPTNGAPGLGSQLRLFDANGNELAANNDRAAPGETWGFDSYIEYTFDTSGMYYVGVSNWLNYAYDPFTGAPAYEIGSTWATGEYTLVIQDLSPQPPEPPQPSGPDLKGEWCLATDEAKWGQTIAVEKAEVINAGSQNAGSFLIQWYLSCDPQGSSDDILLQRTNGSTGYFHGSIAGNSQGATFSVALKLPSVKPAAWPDTHFYIVMRTDASNVVAESDENNNFGQVGETYDYDPIRITQPPARTITETIQGSAPLAYPELRSQIQVTLKRVDQGTGPIKNMRTWVIVHGRNSNPYTPNMDRLIRAVKTARPYDQVLTLNWSQGAADNASPIWDYGLQGSRWIAPVANWTAGILNDLGIQAYRVGLIGHSWGAHVSGEIARHLDELQGTMVDGLVALDPAVLTDYYTGDTPDFSLHAQMSWAFNSSAYGSNAFAMTAAQSFNVWVGDPLTMAAHGRVIDLFASMILQKPDSNRPYAHWFKLGRLINGDWGPWGCRAGFEADLTGMLKDGHWVLRKVVF